MVIGVFMTALFVLSVLIKRNDVADVAWGTGVLLVAVTSYLQSEQSTLMLLLLILAVLWGLRLTVRIFNRNRKKEEDYRYKKWRDTWGKWFYLRSFFQVYLLQGLLMIVIGYPFIHLAQFGSGVEISTITLIGLSVWFVGFFFEVVGDYQLDAYIADTNKKERILKTGLWRYSRHPNYFGEVTMWWGIWLMVAPVGMSWLVLVSPLMITFLILKVSGVPLLEKKFADNPDFEQYKKETSVFLPLPPNIQI